MVYLNQTREHSVFPLSDVKQHINNTLALCGKRRKILVIPPDISRYHSFGGHITRYIYDFYKEHEVSILPATGLHAPMTSCEIEQMFGDIPKSSFYRHHPINNVDTIGHISGSKMDSLTDGLWKTSWPCQVNRMLCSSDYDLVISVGQVVPHEVAGMSNYNKNIFVGIGGDEGIDRSHYISALYGIENTMGKIDTPVRRIFNYASRNFLKHTKILYILTVIQTNPEGNNNISGLFIGDDEECFFKAVEWSQKVNITRLKEPVKKMVVYLDPLEYKSTWLGNKAIYRTRMAIEKGGELIILGPGISTFGETQASDALIRKYGYSGTERIRSMVEHQGELRSHLAIAAHLIHGSANEQFTVSYCPGKIKKEQIEKVGFLYKDLNSMQQKYDPATLKAGYNRIGGTEEIYFVNNPGLGLWIADEAG